MATFKSFKDMADHLAQTREQEARAKLAAQREDVRKAANLRKTSHLRAKTRGKGRGPAVAR